MIGELRSLIPAGAEHDDEAAAWDGLAKQCEDDSLSANVENVLSKLRVKIYALGGGEVLMGLDRERLGAIEEVIRATIADATTPDDARIPDPIPHDNFAAWVRTVHRTAPLELFTTNYDVLLERACERARIPVFDGFVGTHKPFFYPECLDGEHQLPRPEWVRLWKLHGSVTWSFDRTSSNKITRSGESDRGELILPSHRKYDESRKQPYVAYMDRLARLLNEEHSLLVTSGYSFGDEHLNAIIFGALDNQKTSNVIALQHGDLHPSDEPVIEARRRSNLTVIGSNGGVISGAWGDWVLTEPVDAKTHSFMDVAFDSNAEPEESGSSAAESGALRGRMRLGDFNWFCDFLRAMGAEAK